MRMLPACTAVWAWRQTRVKRSVARRSWTHLLCIFSCVCRRQKPKDPQIEPHGSITRDLRCTSVFSLHILSLGHVTLFHEVDPWFNLIKPFFPLCVHVGRGVCVWEEGASVAIEHYKLALSHLYQFLDQPKGLQGTLSQSKSEMILFFNYLVTTEWRYKQWCHMALSIGPCTTLYNNNIVCI